MHTHIQGSNPCRLSRFGSEIHHDVQPHSHTETTVHRHCHQNPSTLHSFLPAQLQAGRQRFEKRKQKPSIGSFEPETRTRFSLIFLSCLSWSLGRCDSS